MTRRSFVDILIDQPSTYPRSQASQAKLARDLGWSEDKVDRVATNAANDPSLPIFRGHGATSPDSTHDSLVTAALRPYYSVLVMLASHHGWLGNAALTEFETAYESIAPGVQR